MQIFVNVFWNIDNNNALTDFKRRFYVQYLNRYKQFPKPETDGEVSGMRFCSHHQNGISSPTCAGTRGLEVSKLSHSAGSLPYVFESSAASFARAMMRLFRASSE